MYFPGGSDGKASACNVADLGLIPGWEDPLEKAMVTLPGILLPRKSHGQSHGVAKSQTQLSDFTFFTFSAS